MKQIIEIGGVQHILSGDRLQVLYRDDTVLDICLSPSFDGVKIKPSEWVQRKDGSFTASLGKYGDAFLAERHGRLAFWIETPIKQFEQVTYLSDGIISGSTWRSFVSDDYERLWDKKISTNIPISSAYAHLNSPDGSTDGGMTDPDDLPPHYVWNVHARTFALSGEKSWLGISIPGPWGIGVTRLNMEKARFNLKFEVMQTGCTDGRMPVIYFCPGLADGYDILDEHKRVSEQLGLINLEKKEYPKWWTNPWFGYYDEMERLLNAGEIDKNSANVADQLDLWVSRTKELCQIENININLEQGCYRLYGDYRPADVMGTETAMRNKIDSWRSEGIRAGHYIHPFIVNTKVPFYREHPEAFCTPKDPDYKMSYALEQWDKDNPEYAPIDWTHPAGREFMLNWVEYLLSSKPGCMNYDILRSNHWRSPDPIIYNFHDPDWGVGDMMTYKVQKLLYERAKEVKPDSMVTKLAAADCYMQPTFDMMQMTEDWTHSMDPWYRRAQVATRLTKNTLIWIDPWFVTRTKWNEYFMSMMVICTPETQAVEHTTHCYYPLWMKLGEKHHRRRRTGIHVHMNSPCEPADELRLSWGHDTLEVYRRKTAGPLAGWYGALALSRRCFVSYSENQALVGSSEDRLDQVPLPPEASLEGITQVLHDGGEEEIEYLYDKDRNTVEFFIEDCGKEVFYYRIRYSLSD